MIAYTSHRPRREAEAFSIAGIREIRWVVIGLGGLAFG